MVKRTDKGGQNKYKLRGETQSRKQAVNKNKIIQEERAKNKKKEGVNTDYKSYYQTQNR